MKKLLVFLILPFFLQATISPWGKDSDLVYPLPKNPTKKLSGSVFLADKAILFHQKVISPTTGPRSSFRPTSSLYTQLAIKRYGFLKGFIMGCDRLLRENNEEWVYRKIKINDLTYKYDPARENKWN